ncbi:hypothetical protein ACKWRH_06480 [Bradyrhizobium sp. Pa8]|uniref:hypothetical protein n=1 Tax=Bradyrhizobium sp. Pa8 TaxID=3386552 RepID=UPI00403F9065
MEDGFSANYTGRAITPASAGGIVGLGIGINAVSLTVSVPMATSAAIAITYGMVPSYHGQPNLGLNFVAAMEFTGGVTSTFNSAGNNTVSIKTRM